MTVTDDEPLGTASDPSGTVTFSLPGADPGTFSAGTCTLGGNGDGTSDCSVTYTPSAKGDGSHTIGAAYGGSTAHTASSDIDGVTVTVDHRATATAVVCATPVVVGQGSLCTATVDDVSANGAKSPPSGSVAFTGEGPGGFTPATSCTLSPLDADSSSCAVTYTPTARGDGAHLIGAGYTSDEDVHAGSSDADGFTITVNKAATTTTITSDANDPSVTGETYTIAWTVTVDAPGAGTPAGTVTVGDGDGDSCSAPVEDGECSFASISAGAKTLTATYGGDADFLGSADTEDHQVDPADTTTVISSDNPDPSVVGEAVTIAYSVTVDSPGTGSPTGTVTVSDADSAQFCSASVAAGSCQITFEEAGTHHLTATYAGDTDFNGSASVAEDHLVNTRHTSTQVLCVPSSIVVAQATTCTVTVTDDEPLGTASDPSGTVTFSLPGADPGTFSAGTCTLGGNGDGTSDCSVTYTPSAKGDGSHTIGAAYGGSTAHTASSDIDGVTVTVDHRATTTSVDCVPATIDAGTGTTCTVLVSDASLGGTASDPTGSVTFATDAIGTFNPPAATCALVGNGDGTSDCSVGYDMTAATPAGTHNISASYVSDEDVHAGGASASPFTLTVTTSANVSISKTAAAGPCRRRDESGLHPRRRQCRAVRRPGGERVGHDSGGDVVRIGSWLHLRDSDGDLCGGNPVAQRHRDLRRHRPHRRELRRRRKPCQHGHDQLDHDRSQQRQQQFDRHRHGHPPGRPVDREGRLRRPCGDWG